MSGEGPVATADDPILKPADLARRWRISPHTVLQLIARGALPGIQIGRQWRVTEADAAAYERRRSSTCANTTEAAS